MRRSLYEITADDSKKSKIFCTPSFERSIFSAFATGWQNRGGYSKVFPLSDHADFSQLLEYVKTANPKNVFTVHGYAREFAHFVQRRLGISARPLEECAQKTLEEF